jgi:hypothetical protein
MAALRVQQASVADRLSEHFLWRLRHALVADVIASSIANGLIAANPFEFDGRSCLRFRLSASAAERTDSELVSSIRSVEQVVLGLGPRHRFIFEDGEVVIDESFTPVRVKRSGASEISLQIKSPTAGQSLTTGMSRDWVDLVELISRKAVRPSAGDLAALLLLARGVDSSDLTLAETVGKLSKPRLVSIILCEVDGFEDRILHLLARGLVLPGESVVTRLGQAGSRAEVRQAAKRGVRRHVLAIAGSRYDAESHELPIQDASKGQLPLMVVSELKSGIPKSLRAAADLQLTCPSLNSELVRHVIEAVTGEVCGASFEEMDFSLIGLDDLDLAVGQGNSAAEAAERLVAIAQDRVPATDRTRRSDSIAKARSGRSVLGSSSPEIAAAKEVHDMSGYPEALYHWTSDLKSDLDLWKTGSLGWEAVGASLLLSGPPGTGKTAFARSLAKTLGVSLLETSVSAWLQPSHLGAVLKAMQTSFSDAAAHSPTVLFVDEIDGIGMRANSAREHADYWNSVVNNLLEQLNPSVRAKGIIFVGATNRPDEIDPALRRAGRLKPHIEIGLPNTDALVGIFRHHLGSDLATVVRSAPDLETSHFLSESSL